MTSRVSRALGSVADWLRGRDQEALFGVSNVNYGLYSDDDDTVNVLPSDHASMDFTDVGAFFKRGREYESVFTNHRYTKEELKVLGGYESLNYLPPDSKVHRAWLSQQPSRTEWDVWVVMGIIGFVVGMVGFLLHQLIDVIADYRYEFASDLIQTDGLAVAWLFTVGYSLCFLVPAAAIVVYLRPSAASSGMPELIGFLNGTLIRHIFNIKTFAVKFFSCALAVGSGMPVGPEGPMIHMGALVGAGVSQFQSKTLGFNLPIFERFRNSKDRRNFISAGAAAGIASAFGAPVGGLLFAMEEVSSYWDMKLSWQTFFCCMVSAFTTDLFNSAFSGFRYEGTFGQFQTDRYILFNVSSGIDMNILAVLPCAILGCIGGALGAGFTFFNLKIVRLRRKLHAYLSKISERLAKVVKVVEPVLILFIWITISVLLPEMFPCTPFECTVPKSESDEVIPALCDQIVSDDGDMTVSVENNVEYYTCPYQEHILDNGSVYINGSYSQTATLFFVTGEDAIKHLYSRNTHLQFNYFPLLTMLLFYYWMACWAAGTYISSGLVVPMLLIGALYGRMLGKFMVDIFGVPETAYWDWLDPGAMALIGSVSFFGGVTRLTMSLTVIMVEMTNDIQFLLLIMVAVLFAKWIGDFVTHPFYHALIELKCIPFLDQDPVVVTPTGDRLNLELYNAGNVMAKPVHTLRKLEKASCVAKALLDTSHGGFPIVANVDGNGDGGDPFVGDATFVGLLTRAELLIILLRYWEGGKEVIDGVHSPSIRFDEIASMINQKKVISHAEVESRLKESAAAAEDDDHLINLADYVNTSTVAVPPKFSLIRTHIIFRSLGLRHLVVVNSANQVEGIVTRKDLMGFSLEDKLIPVSMGAAATGEMQPTTTGAGGGGGSFA